MIVTPTLSELEARLIAYRLPQRYLKARRACGLFIMVAVSPVLVAVGAAIALAILLDSGGPVFFTQMRSGRDGRMFRMVKFRTMRRSETEDPLTQLNDARVTRIGRFLRAHRLDELPQLWNVLHGEMSMIGPRPESSDLSDLFVRSIPLYRYRRIVRPGITGWAQVTIGYAPDLESMQRTVDQDLYYIMNISPWLDLKIVVRTIRCMVAGSGAR